ncbi:MAG: aminoacyl-tRNA hydrolase [Rickettsiaceae bacterium]|nr:aminoacyl-tRNA hydrolase [Rickettsiaceae bacterium]
MLLILGLGNPGSKYESTRHNAGFMALDTIASKMNISFKEMPKFRAQVATGFLGATKIILVKPETFMNLSGESAYLIKKFYKIDNDNIIVIHDDLDIFLGKVRHKIGGGSAGHNGIKSLDQYIGSNYHRIRIGIGRPAPPKEVSSYVLEDFADTEKDKLKSILENIADSINNFAQKNFTSIVCNTISQNK